LAGAQGEQEKANAKAGVKDAGDAKAEINALRTEVAKLRKEVDAALAEIKTLKEFLRESFAAPSEKPMFRGKPVAFWLEQFKDSDPDYRAKAAEALGALAQRNKDLIPVLGAGLADPDPRVTVNVSSVLAHLNSPESVPFVIDILKARKSASAMIDAAN